VDPAFLVVRIGLQNVRVLANVGVCLIGPARTTCFTKKSTYLNDRPVQLNKLILRNSHIITVNRQAYSSTNYTRMYV
jgi:hypothetical protein